MNELWDFEIQLKSIDTISSSKSLEYCIRAVYDIRNSFKLLKYLKKVNAEIFFKSFIEFCFMF